MIRLFKRHEEQKTLYAVMTIGAIIGFIASFWQMIEKLTMLKDPVAPLVCNVNAVFNCSNILNVWQSSVFGFPNALMCIIFFIMLFTVGIIGWNDGSISKNLRLIFQGFTLFFIGFGFWYLWQSIFVVGAICIFCLFCYAAVLAISFAWLRINQKDLPINKAAKNYISKTIYQGTDIFIWLSIALIIVAEIIIKFL
jgi:uncharacterized membrane protein